MHGRLLRRLRTGGVRGQAIDEPERAVAELAGAAAALLARRGDDVKRCSPGSSSSPPS